MVGSPAHVVIGEAVAKGLDDVDEAVLFAMAADMALGRIEAPYGARPDVSVYDTYGYYPSDLVGTSVSWTQEVALADYALALGGEGWLSAEDQARLAERAHAWKPLYDAELGYFHARDSAGVFQPLNSTTVWGDEFSEGNAEQYRWLVPHDPEGLAEIMGGEDIALQRLDAFFEASLDAEKSDVRGIPKPYYWAGNEHDLQVPFLFSAWGQREQTSRWAGWALDTFYGTGADGYPGNDDGGAMAAWVVWTVIGLYPMAGTDRYFLGEPRFSRVELDLPDGTFVIERSGTGPVRRVELDGEALPDESLRHDQLRGGSVLHFVGSAP
jgi:predicted alpha-1,2-mannosidase